MGQDEQRRADLAEKLRRSLEDRPEEDDASSTSQDEELRALLRARLMKEQMDTSAPAESEYVMVDLDEFEDEDTEDYEDVETFDESFEEEEILDEEEEILDEEEEILDEEEEILDDEEEILDEEEEILDEEEEILDEEEEILDEEEEILDEEEEILDEEEEILDEEEEILDEEEEILDEEEEILDEEDGDVPFAAAESVLQSPLDANEEGEVISDDLVNGQSLDGLLSGAFMDMLDEDTRRRLYRAPVHTTDEDGAWDDAQMTLAMPIMSAVADESLPVEAAEEDDGEIESPRASEPCDPMQLGFETSETRRAEDILDELGIPTYTPAHKSDASDDTYHVIDETTERNMATEMYLRMGYGAELDSPTRRYDGTASEVEHIRGEHIASRPVSTRNVSDAVASENTPLDPADTPAWDAKYAKAQLWAIIRLAIVSVCALFMTLYDLLPYTATGAGEGLDLFVHSFWYPVCGIFMLLICAAPMWTRLGRGVRSLWDFSPVGYAVPAVGVAVAVIHAVIACFMSNADRALPLFGGAALLSLAISALTELLSVKAERDAFLVVSSGKTKYVLDEATDEVADTALDGADTDVCLRVHRVAHVFDYFRWVNRYDEGLSTLNYLLPVSLVGAILCGGATAVLGGELGADAVCAFTATMMCMLPVAFSVSFSLPLMLANSHVTQRGSAVLGEAASDAYAFDSKHPAHLVWRDGDALKATELKEITLRGDADADRYRRMAKKLFLVIDNALAEEDTDGVFDDVAGYGVEILESNDGFVRLHLIDDVRREATEVMMGTHDNLTRHGIRLPKANMERVYKKTERSQVIYFAFDGQFRLAYAVEYRTKRSFINGVNCLRKMGLGASVASCDPLVKNGSMMIPNSDGGMMPVGVIRPTRADGTHRLRESGVVATGRAVNLAYPLMACRRVRIARRRGVLVSLLSMAVGFGAIVALAATELTALLQPWTVMLWMLTASGVVCLTSLLSVRPRDMEIPEVKRMSQKGNS